MGRVLTNNMGLQMAVESLPGVQPTAGWKIIEPNSIGKYGPTLTKITRSPISRNRQRRKGALTDLDSAVEFECDITIDHLRMFAESLFFCVTTGATLYYPTAVTATGYTVPANGALAQDTLVFVRGSSIAANNGFKPVLAASTATEIKVANTVIESGVAARNMTVEICGFRGAAADLKINAALNLASTTLSFVAAGTVPNMIQIGQMIWIGGVVGTATAFATTADRGLSRVISKTANELVLDKRGILYVADIGTAKTIDVFFGQFYRNYMVGSTNYLDQTLQFELQYENGALLPGDDTYEYAQGNYLNECTFDMSVAAKGTMKLSFMGLDTLPPGITRATGGGTAAPPNATEMVNTSTDFTRLRITEIDETGATTDFKSVSMRFSNNVSGEKVLDKLGSRYVNAGVFDAEITADVLFTDVAIATAMRFNRTMTMEVGGRNDDGAFLFDIPSMTIEGGDKQYPVNQTVSISVKSMGFQDPRFGTTATLSVFPYLPVE